MIYWEKINPRFFYNIINVLDHDVWYWDMPQGWTDGVDNMTDGFEFSEGYPVESVSKEIRDRITPRAAEPVGHTDHLVLYYWDHEGVHVSLIGTSDPRFMQGFSPAPPQWWVPIDGLTPMMAMYERVVAFREITKKYGHPSMHAQARRDLQTHIAGYCSECGILNEYHVAHKVPGFEDFKWTSPTAARPYFEAYKKHYGGALARMTDNEVLAMPLPPRAQRLTLIMLDLKRRIENPQVPKGALDRLMNNDLLGE